MKNLALMSAIALTSAVGFTACSSSDEATADVNPTFDGTSVRTDFAFNIATGPMGTTRMQGAVTQQAGNFNGMKDMYLLPFNEQPANAKTTNVGINNYPLGTLTGITADASSKVYALQIPVGTTDFLFYAKSDPASGVTNVTTALPLNTRKGTLTSTLTPSINNTDDISFSLDKILTTSTLGDDADKLAEYLSYIAQAKVPSVADANVDIHWYEAPTKAATIGQYATLSTMYTKFTTIDNNTARAGSAEGVRRLVFDLYVTAKAIVVEAGSDADVVALANEICNRIKNGKNGGCRINIVDTDANPTNWTADSWDTSASYTPKEKFPHNLLLPMGAAQLTCSQNLTANPVEEPVFTYKDPAWYDLHVTGTTPSVTIGGTGVNLSKICYPAELVYFDNSPLRATNTYKKANEYPLTVGAWDAAFANPASSNEWYGSRVEPSTRAVAMQNNVNYGVAMLKTTVQLEDGNTGTDGIQMYDNQQTLAGGSENKTITLNSTNTFYVSGVLIGGQPASVGWDMTNPGLPTLTEGDNGRGVFTNVIYDQDIPSGTTALGTSASEPIYTLVLDNYTSETTQSAVRFALELVNNSGEDFYGLDGIIPAGHTFYLCGELNPATASDITKHYAKNHGAGYRITKEDKERVFMQDYQTVAVVTIGKNALQKAYSTIPDLRATEVLFGLSVDLTWEQGMEFGVTIE